MAVGGAVGAADGLSVGEGVGVNEALGVTVGVAVCEEVGAAVELGVRLGVRLGLGVCVGVQLGVSVGKARARRGVSVRGAKAAGGGTAPVKSAAVMPITAKVALKKKAVSRFKSRPKLCFCLRRIG